jgi:hypothetical protein
MIKCLHPRVRAIQRSRTIGKNFKRMSTVAVAAYINRMDLHQEADRFIEAYNYTYSDAGVEHVIAQGIVAPENAPGYMRDADPSDKELYRRVTERLWNDAEHAGGKSNAITGREWMLPLPSELDRQEADNLVHNFCQDYMVRRGMVAQYAIHEPNPWNDQRNLHSHVLTTDRDITPEGFAKKKTISLEWHSRELIRQVHPQWEKACNNALRLGNHRDVVIDNRPNAVQLAVALERGDLERAAELNHVPGVHYGKAIKEIEARGLKSYKIADRESLASERWQRDTEEMKIKVAQIMKNHRGIQETLDERISLSQEMTHGIRGVRRGIEKGTRETISRGRSKGLRPDDGGIEERIEKNRKLHRGPHIGF